MTTRDRLVLMVVVALAVLGAGWMMVVSPERKEASQLSSQIESARSTLSSAQGELANAKQAEARYASAYSSVVSLGKAVPADQEVPSLMYELDQASNTKHVDFQSITQASSASGSAAAGPASSAASAGGFALMPFTFTFKGTFFDLFHLINQLQGFTITTQNGLQIGGRLLTIQGINLAPGGSSGTGPAKQELTGTVNASAYVLPAGQTLTAGATPAGPASAAQPASSGSTVVTPGSPAVVEARP